MKNKKKILETILLFAAAIAIGLLIPRFIAERVIVEGESMETTLQDKDNLFTEKISRYFGGLHRFDVIVFYPNDAVKKARGRYYVKRIIGLPGETVQIVGEKILINGEPIEEDYGATEMGYTGIASEPITLSDKEYFVLGDNRKHSKDSRDGSVGVVPLSRIGGRVLFRMFPFNKFGKLNK